MWKIKDVNGAFPPLGGTAALADASPEELRVLLCLVAAGGESDDPAALATAAGCSKPRARSALRYWEEVGVTEEVAAGAASVSPKKKPLRPLNEARETPAHEIAKVITQKTLAGFIDTCQQTVGRQFNTGELNILTSLVEDMPFSREYILILISHCMKKTRKFSFIYLEKMAHSMLEREYLTVEQLNAYLADCEKFASQEWKLRRLLGIGERKLGSREEAYLLRWTGEYHYGEEIIGIAYDITVNHTGKISMPYMDKLLTRFHEAGCATVAEVEALLEQEQAERAAGQLAPKNGGQKAGQFATGAGEGDPSATRGSSFDRQDYMTAALRRSYGDDGKE